MELKEKIAAFAELGRFLEAAGTGEDRREGFEAAIRKAGLYNGWFTEENIRYALLSLGKMLRKGDLEKWAGRYEQLQGEPAQPRPVGVIMAGNIPVVGFHDLLCVLISGHFFKGKLSSDDAFLLPAITEVLCQIAPAFRERITFLEGKLEKIDAVIATGSNNSSRYFEYYFSKYPHIIRKNRNSAAVLTGKETAEELDKLGEDIFRYFGMGCRSVSKLFVPKGYDFGDLFKAVFSWKDIIQNNKYANNYEYNRTIYLMSRANILDNNFLLLKEDIGMHSPVAVVYFEYYEDQEKLLAKLKMDAGDIQCLVSSRSIPGALPFGTTQQPALWDYADRVDTLKFLLEL
jgi:hypothetical protein